jgi:hypothetical protein
MIIHNIENKEIRHQALVLALGSNNDGYISDQNLESVLKSAQSFYLFMVEETLPQSISCTDQVLPGVDQPQDSSPNKIR